MLNKLLFSSIVFLFAFSFYSTHLTAEENGSIETQSGQADLTQTPSEENVEQPALTREEMLERLNTLFEHRLDIREEVPGLSIMDDGSNVYFEYNGIRLEELSDDALMGLTRFVNQKISLKNIENLQRTQRQMRQLRQINQFNRNQRMLRNLRQLNRNNRKY